MYSLVFVCLGLLFVCFFVCFYIHRHAMPNKPKRIYKEWKKRTELINKNTEYRKYNGTQLHNEVNTVTTPRRLRSPPLPLLARLPPAQRPRELLRQRRVGPPLLPWPLHPLLWPPAVAAARPLLHRPPQVLPVYGKYDNLHCLSCDLSLEHQFTVWLAHTNTSKNIRARSFHLNLFIGWLLSVPSTYLCISGTYQLRQISTCYHAETETGGQTCSLTQSHNTRPSSPTNDPITLGAQQDSHWGTDCFSHWYDSTWKKAPPGKQDSIPGLLLSRQVPYHRPQRCSPPPPLPPPPSPWTFFHHS